MENDLPHFQNAEKDHQMAYCEAYLHRMVITSKVEVRYNIPSARGESCEFDLEVKTRPDIQEKDQGDDSASKKNKGTTKT